MKELKFIQACPCHTYYTWQVHLWLESLRNINQSQNAISLIFTPKGTTRNPKWDQIVKLYPEAEFHFYADEDDVTKLIPVYIPVLRPYVLWKHFKSHPELSTHPIFYCDSDILFMQDFDLSSYLDDDINYLSNTNSYINASYFDSKVRDVLPEKVEEYKHRDILAELTSLIGIDRSIAEKNNDHSGGAQYLLKNVSGSFWNKVMNDCIIIRTYLQKVNQEFFENENKGFQSWCADMWAVLWNLWLSGAETRVIPELDFSWSTDPIEKLKENTILHNAGVVSDIQNGQAWFYKGKYHLGADPTQDPHLDSVLQDEKTKTICNWHYANELKKLKTNYNLNY